MYAYDTITEAVADLKKRGYTHDFNISNNRLTSDKLDAHFGHDDFEIREVYRFEGPSDPADEAVVFAIEAPSGALGILVNGYGMYSDDKNTEFVKQLHERIRLKS
ncbi:MAG: phosphoribosylpyrophosphate synthetase [Niastella sp.]|jgi:hypothetical protein|uniref:phosphoribosylpyrophosphate synthetase n=1 Tax=Niastella sp. TaxID=1869183 RepID=UPI00389A9D2D